MKPKFYGICLHALAVASALVVWGGPAVAQSSAAALSGKVSSQQEGPMQGVIVNAQRAGSPIMFSVVTDAQGEYSFPKSALAPGDYTITIRAVGYDLSGPTAIDVASQTPAEKDLTLKKTANLSLQLTNAEWLMSMPGTHAQKENFDGHCGECHTLQRPIFSHYKPADMAKTVQRMFLHTTNAAPAHPYFLQDAGLEFAKPPSKAEAALGAYIATINLSESKVWPYPLKTLPRPTGNATKVMYVTYDLPRKDAAPHDVMMDKNGDVWYSDFQSPFIGKLDPKTGKVVEYPIPIQKPVAKGFPTGGLQIAVDKTGDVWEGTMGQAQVVRLDPKTDKMKIWAAPGWNVGDTRVTMVDPNFQSVDGRVWINEAGVAGGNTSFELDPKTGQFTEVAHPKDSPNSSAYDIVANGQNDVYGMGMTDNYIWKIDANTLKTTFYRIPTVGAGGRRGHIDAQNRLWWAEFYGNGIAMFDPKSKRITEWAVPTPFSNPYDAQYDDKTYVWAGGMSSDRVQRLNVKTGEFTEYLLPHETNIRRVNVDKSGPLSTLWIGDQHNGRIIHVIPLSP